MLEDPFARLVALRLPERAGVVARSDVERVAGELRGLDRVDRAGGRRASRTMRRSFGMTLPSAAAVAAASKPRTAQAGSHPNRE